MAWQAIGLGLSFLGAFGSAKAAKYQHQAQRTIDSANTYAQNTVRKANNELNRATGSLSDYMRSVRNRRTIQAAGDQYNATTQNIGRALDASTTGAFARRIQASEEVGMLQASAAAAGIGGGTVDMINGTMRLQRAMTEDAIQRNEGQATYDMLMQRAGIMDNSYAQYDYTMSADTDDLATTLDPIRGPAPSVTSAVMQWGLGQLTQGKDGGVLGNLVSSLFSGGSSSGKGITPPGRSYSTTPGGFTFFGIDGGSRLGIR